MANRDETPTDIRDGALSGAPSTYLGAPPSSQVAFKDILLATRLEQGLSFHQLAERSRVDVAYLHRLETGQASRPGRNIAIRIAIGLGLDLDSTEDLLLAAGHLLLGNTPLHLRPRDRPASTPHSTPRF